MTAWTKERVALLRGLAGTGITARQAAEIIGDVSADAVLRKSRRIGLRGVWPRPDGIKTRRILDLAKEGIPPRVIETMMAEEGIPTSRHTIMVTMSRARDAGEDIPSFRSSKDNLLPVECDEFIEPLCDAARARGLTPASLAGLILDAVVSDNLISAVLDTEAA